MSTIATTIPVLRFSEARDADGYFAAGFPNDCVGKLPGRASSS